MIFQVLLAFALPTVPGFLFAAYCLRRLGQRSFLENLVLGYGAGMGLVTLSMFLLGVLRVPFSFGSVAAVLAAAAALLVVLILKSGMSLADLFPPGRPKSPASGVKLAILVVLAGWLTLKLWFVVSEGALLPVHDWDSWANWSAGAKFFFYERGLALSQADEHFFGRGYRLYLNYPLHDPLLQVWVALCLGEFNEVYVKFWNVLYYTGIVGLVFAAVRREASALLAVLAAFLTASAPLLTYHAFDAYADLPLAFHGLAAAVCLRLAVEAVEKDLRGGSGPLLLTGVFVAASLWTKQEGLFFVLAFGAAILLLHLVRKAPPRGMLSFAAPIAVVAVPWLGVLHRFNLPILGRGERSAEATFHPEILLPLAGQMFLSANFNIIFVIFFAVLVIGRRTIVASGLKYLLIAIAGVMAPFLAMLLMTENYRFVMDLTGVNRNILTFLPMLYYFCAVVVAKLVQSCPDPEGNAQQAPKPRA